MGSCVVISRPNTNDNEWLINHSCTVVKKATSKNNSAHITLRLKQLDEELAIQQREWDAERRAFEHEKRVLQIKYDLLQKHIAERTKASKGKKNSGDGEQNIAYNNTEGTLQSTNRTPPSEAFVNSSRKQQPVWKQTDLTRLNLPDDQLDEIQHRDIRAFLYTAPNNPNLIANRSEEMNEHNFTPIAHSTTTIGMPVRGKQTINNVCHDQWSKKRSSVPANIESLSKLTLLADDVAALAKSERNELSLAPSVQHSTSKDCRSYNKRSNAPSTFVGPIVPEPAPPPAQGDAAFPFIDGFLDRSMFRSENITSISEELVKSLLLSSALQSAPIPKYSKAITKIVNAGVQYFLGHVKAVEHLIQSQNMLKVMEFVTKLSIIVKMDLLSNKKTSNAVYYRVLYFTELTKPRTAVWLNSTPNGNVMSLTLSQKKCAHVSCCLQAEMCLVRCRQKKPVLPFDCDGGETSLMAVQWCENRGREQMKGQDDYWFTGIFVRREKSLGVCYSCPCWLEGSMKENGITNAVRMPQSTKIIAKMRTGMKTTTSITVPRMCVDGGILRVLMRGLLVVPGLCIEILSPDILVACRISIKPPIPIGATYAGIAEPLPAPVVSTNTADRDNGIDVEMLNKKDECPTPKSSSIILMIVSVQSVSTIIPCKLVIPIQIEKAVRKRSRSGSRSFERL